MSKVSKVLILDENESNLLFFETILTQLQKDFKIYTSTSGPAAEHLVNEEKIQMVICAWEMDAMPGTVFIQRIRQNKSRRYIPCMVFSKRMNEHDITLTKELGFQDILGMPFDRKSAEEMIVNILDHEENLSSDEKKVRKIESLVSDGIITEALKLCDKKITSNGPFKHRACLALAEIWVQSKHYDKAEIELLKVLDDDPDNTEALKIYARVYSSTERHDQAISVLETITKKSPHNMNSLLCLGSAYVESDRHDQAKEVFSKVESMDEGFQALKDEQGKLAFKEGDLPLAVQLLAETRSGQELARHFNNIAISKIAMGEFDEGIATYHNSIKLLKDKANLYRVYYNLALAWKKKGSLEECFKYFCQSFLQNPRFEKAYSSIAITAKDMKSAGLKLDEGLVAEVKSARKIEKSSA